MKKITFERNKAVNHCLNLESKREQLHLLIKQLQNLSYTRECNFLDTQNTNSIDQFDYINPANVIINKELSKALQEHQDINNDISSLKEKINVLNKKLKK